MRASSVASLIAGVLVGCALCVALSRQRATVLSPYAAKPSQPNQLRLRNCGDLAAPGVLARVLALRAVDREIIFMLSDAHHVRMALNLILNLDALGLHHHVVIASSADVCSSLWRRSRGLGLSLACGTSSFLQRGQSAAIDGGLAAYGIGDDHVYHLWWQRWFFLSEAVGLGFRVLSLDTDVSVRASPYPLLHGALAHHELLTGLDTDQPTFGTYYFPQINVGLVYARGPPGGAGHAVLLGTRRRLESILVGRPIPWPRVPAGSMSLWDQDTFKDALETVAFSPAVESHRHGWLHAAAREGGPPPHRLSKPLPSDWAWGIEHLRFFGADSPALPSTWLPLTPPAGALSSSARSNASFGGVPLWLFSSYRLCPHGAVCDGRWAWRPAPVLVGHVVGSKAKFWLLRLLGWWRYDAATPEETFPRVDAAGEAKGEAMAAATRPAVFPAAVVRPLVLRGAHGLSIPYTHSRTNASGVHALRTALVHWSLLGLVLGRRPVLPFVPCEVPVPETPPSLRKSTIVVKLADPALCDESTRAPGWRLVPTVPLEPSPMHLRRTVEMGALGDYSSVSTWPPARAPSCCQLMPALKCIDQYGADGELFDELLLNERDLGHLAHAYPEGGGEGGEGGEGGGRGSGSGGGGGGGGGSVRGGVSSEEVDGGGGGEGGTHVLRLAKPTSLEAIARLSGAHTLIVDVADGGLSRLPSIESVTAAVRQRLALKKKGKNVVRWRERRCLEQLLAGKKLLQEE